MSQQWYSRDGPIRINKMSNEHIERTILKCKEKISMQGNIIYNNRRTKAWIKLFKNELKKRERETELKNSIKQLTYSIF